MGFDEEGLLRLKTDLGKLAARAVPTAHRAVAKVAHDIEATAKVLAPVDTGNLMGSISATVVGLSAEIGPTAYYGGYVEEGTSDEEGNARTAPQPYMAPAAEQHFPNLEKALGAIMDAT